MPVYSDTFKMKIVEKLLSPNNQSIARIATETGVAKSTLFAWKSRAYSNADMNKKSTKKKWSPVAKLRILGRAESLSNEELGNLLRSEGLHESELARWRQEALEVLGGFKAQKAEARSHAKELALVKRELKRKTAALAETAALLVLQKKVNDIWADEDDAMMLGSGK